MSKKRRWWWNIGNNGLVIMPAFDETIGTDFVTREDGELWIKQQLANLVLGNPLDTTLARTLVVRPHHREALLEQAKRELLND